MSLHAMKAALLGAAPGLVAVAGPEGSTIPLLAGRSAGGGQATAFVCRGFVCQVPTTELSRVAEEVGALPTTVRECAGTDPAVPGGSP